MNAQKLLEQLRSGHGWSAEEASEVALAIMEGHLPEEGVREVLTALASKPESDEEVIGFARAMRSKAISFPGPREEGATDLCGTGGAAAPSFNISTVSAFVVAGAGLPVAKHGNASARGPCGSSDLLEALGLPVKTSLPFARTCWERARLVFLHAPLFHPATRLVAPIRRSLKIRTIFNQLGPLTNPAQVRFQVVGCFDREYGRRAARVLPVLGVERGAAVGSDRGEDELSSLGRSWAIPFPGDRIAGRERTSGADLEILPEQLLHGTERAGSLQPRAPTEAAAQARALLEGRGDGALRGAVLLTSGLALKVAGHARDLSEGVQRAREALESGNARAKLESLETIARSSDWGGGL